MIFSDEDNLYIKPETIQRLVKDLGLESTGIYLVFKSIEYEYPDGITETLLLMQSKDGLKNDKPYLDKLVKKGYLKKNNEGFLVDNYKVQ